MKEFRKFDKVPAHCKITRGPYTIEASHWLPNLPNGHKCRNPHGHSYQVFVSIEGPLENSMVRGIEFEQIDAVMRPIQDSCCHHCWNDKIENPTVEIIAFYLAGMLRNYLAVPVTVAVQEGPRGRAEVSL